MMQQVSLSDIAQVRPGYSFRGKLRHDPVGPVVAVQMKDVDRHAGVDWDRAVRLDLPGREPGMWIEADDVTVIARGRHHHAILLDRPPVPAVFTPHFFHLRVHDPRTVLPAFLAWQLNQQRAQAHLHRSAEGSGVRHLRRQMLEATPLVLPPFDEQRRTIAHATASHRRRTVLMHLLDNHDHHEQTIGDELIDRWTRKAHA